MVCLVLYTIIVDDKLMQPACSTLSTAKIICNTIDRLLGNAL